MSNLCESIDSCCFEVFVVASSRVFLLSHQSATRVNTQKIEANDCSVALLSIPKIAIKRLKVAPIHVAPWRRCGKHCLRTGSGWGREV